MTNPESCLTITSYLILKTLIKVSCNPQYITKVLQFQYKSI